MSSELTKITFLTILKIFLISSKLLASVDQDCSNSSFYIKNINVDLTKESINEARYQAEQKSKFIGFKRLTNRLMIKINPATLACEISTNLAPASAVPPVAIKSSIINIFSFD